MHTRYTVAGWFRAFGLLGPGLLVSLVLGNAKSSLRARVELESVRAFKDWHIRPGSRLRTSGRPISKRRPRSSEPLTTTLRFSSSATGGIATPMIPATKVLIESSERPFWNDSGIWWWNNSRMVTTRPERPL